MSAAPDAVSAAFIAARGIHYAAAMGLFGELVFASFIAAKETADEDARVQSALRRRIDAVFVVGLVAAAVSAVAWLFIESANMAGASVGEALMAGAFATVLSRTDFGHVFVLRMLLLLLLAGTLWRVSHASRDARTRGRIIVALVIAGAWLALLAAAGHAAAATAGRLRLVHVGTDALHLLASGAWLGALPPLVHRLAHRAPGLAGCVDRFSWLGILCVGMLIVTGIVNALYLVGSFPALFGTRYGVVLLLKLGLFAALVAIATVNRLRLAPRLSSGDARAAAALRRNALAEIALGIAVVGIVAALGTMVPAAHQSPAWPFPFTLDLRWETLTGKARGSLLVAVGFALFGTALVLAGLRRASARAWVPGCVTLLLSLAVAVRALAVPAFPTTYAASPIRYDVDAVAHGASLFAQHCSACHGADGRGDGAAGASLAIKPANLDAHALHHPEGDLYWWIAHGISDSPMPAFGDRLSERAIWQLVQFLVARASADALGERGAGTHEQAIARVPDFTYEWPGQGQLALSTGPLPTLVVLCGQESKRRLERLAADRRLPHAVRIVAVALPDSLPSASDVSALHAMLDPAVPSVYAMFAARDGQHPSHTELLLDTAGRVRGRWTGLPASGTDRDAEIVRAARQARSAPAMSDTMHHHGH